MMRKTLTILTILLAITAVTAFADTGVGVILGDPSGISLLFSERVALGVGWDVSNYFHFHTDLWLASGVLAGPLEWYAGLGGKLQVYNADSDVGPTWDPDDDADDDFGLGVRIPLGIQWYASNRLELFGELVPGLQILPATGVDVDAGIGIRFHL
ncbi:MAG: hypothetical protein ACLFQZ_01115 [Spirochaetaceae bacterium]